ncbi:MAG TPA: flagellar basal body rod protein FlgC [Alphaproteobacteria bacterium]|jgi:flagellar basal-body rod protein FlgC|nr:flagellar basal body rod protein FlgC [Alphaproteobacteria bacterium]
MEDFSKTLRISAAGMRAQSVRMRVVAENLANADSLPLSPGEDPYRRKLVGFRNVLDHQLGVETVQISRFDVDRTPFTKRFDPGHPGADADGYVKVPNVNSVIEMMDLREAQRSYAANINVIEAAKRMLMRTVDMLK